VMSKKKEGHIGKSVLVAPKPLKKPNLDFGPARRIGKWAKNSRSAVTEFSCLWSENTSTLPTFVVLRKGVRINDIEPAHAEDFFAIYEVLPFTFYNFYTWFAVPAQPLHMLEYIRMRLNDYMYRWGCLH
jgi:hypothetical protein